MSHPDNSPDEQLEALTGEFQNIPVRIVLDIFCGYLGRLHEPTAAADATRLRIIDACRAA